MFFNKREVGIILGLMVVAAILAGPLQAQQVVSKADTYDLTRPSATGELSGVSRKITIQRDGDGNVVGSTEEIFVSAKSETLAEHDENLAKIDVKKEKAKRPSFWDGFLAPPPGYNGSAGGTWSGSYGNRSYGSGGGVRVTNHPGRKR
jgi:hypothetical protein